MAVELLQEDMTYDVFWLYNRVLHEKFGRAYADFVMGSPVEIIIPPVGMDEMRRSYEECTCVSCTNRISTEAREACIFETEEGGEAFYICHACQ